MVTSKASSRSYFISYEIFSLKQIPETARRGADYIDVSSQLEDLLLQIDASVRGHAFQIRRELVQGAIKYTTFNITRVRIQEMISNIIDMNVFELTHEFVDIVRELGTRPMLLDGPSFSLLYLVAPKAF